MFDSTAQHHTRARRSSIIQTSKSSQSVSILSPPSPSSRRACSCNARKNGSMPTPASSGRPSVRISPPSRPVRSAMSRLRTAARNWGEDTTRSSVSTLGGLGRSGGRCGNRADTSSGRDANSGRRLAGVSTSRREISGSWAWVAAAAAAAREVPAAVFVPREETRARIRARSAGVAWDGPGRACDLEKWALVKTLDRDKSSLTSSRRGRWK